MELAKDLFVTDARAPYLSLVLASRDLDAHRLLSGLTADEELALHAALAAGVASVRDVLAAAWARQAPEAGTASFGCGT
jgi:hypothetical protein